MITVIRWILLPFSFLYQFVVWSRNTLYDCGVLKSRRFDIPTINVGNLAIGGAGKSPMTEYLIRLLKKEYRLSTLSRGYGRKTKGFRIVEVEDSAVNVGDEPLQFKRKFPDIGVAVSENRCFGVAQLERTNDLIILDDAYQHRKLTPGFSVLLFDYSSLFKPFLLLPTGDFRDNFSSAKRADVVVITKCPEDMSLQERASIEGRLQKYYQKDIFYSTIAYAVPQAFDLSILESPLSAYDVLLFTGIANPTPLLDYLIRETKSVKALRFADHHNFSETDFEKVRNEFAGIRSKKKIILTTEKDMQRVDLLSFEGFPLYYIPITICFLDNHRDFDRLVYDYLNRSLKR